MLTGSLDLAGQNNICGAELFQVKGVDFLCLKLEITHTIVGIKANVH